MMYLQGMVVAGIPLLIVVSLLSFSHLGERGVSAQPIPPCGDQQIQEEVRAIMQDALDVALRQHIAHLYEVWMKDEKGQPQRAAAGVHQGVSSYVRGRQSVQHWKLQPCR